MGHRLCQRRSSGIAGREDVGNAQQRDGGGDRGVHPGGGAARVTRLDCLQSVVKV